MQNILQSHVSDVTIWKGNVPVKLPQDKEKDKEMMEIPKPFKVLSLPLLQREIHHHPQASGHEPSREARSGRKVGRQESNDARRGRRARENPQLCTRVSGIER